jgi:ABC-2 type transport system permease protein
MWTFVALLVIITTSALVAGEFAENTMKTMVSRPFSRNQILSAKLVTTILFTAEMMLMTFLLTLITTALLFGTNGIDTTQLLWLGGKTVAVSGIVGSLLTLLFDFLSTLVFVIFSFFLATVTHSRAAATGFSIFVVFGSSIFTELALRFSWGKYIYFADTAFSSFISKGSPIYGMSLGFAVLYSIVCTLILLIASYFTYEKRDIN